MWRNRFLFGSLPILALLATTAQSAVAGATNRATSRQPTQFNASVGEISENGVINGWAPPKLAAPLVGVAPTVDGQGVWLAGSDGGVFAFGDAPFYGSGYPTPSPTVAIIAVSGGYAEVDKDEVIQPFGPFSGLFCQGDSVNKLVSPPEAVGAWLVELPLPVACAV
jgi:hypothetical protein